MAGFCHVYRNGDRPTCQWYLCIWLIAHTGDTVAGFCEVYRDGYANMLVVLGHMVNSIHRWHSGRVLVCLQR